MEKILILMIHLFFFNRFTQKYVKTSGDGLTFATVKARKKIPGLFKNCNSFHKQEISNFDIFTCTGRGSHSSRIQA